MATDLAEFIGAALGFNLLFGIPLFWAGVLTGVFSFAILALQARGARALEIAITDVRRRDPGRLRGPVRAHPTRRRRASPRASLTPQFDGTESVLLATGILGATVMPHVIYLHSALTQRRVVGRSEEERRQDLPLRADRRDHRDDDRRRHQHVDADHGGGGLPQPRPDRRRGHRRGVRPAGRPGGHPTPRSPSAWRCWPPGLSSSSVGTLAGQVVMQGFIDRRSRSSCGAASRWRRR